MKLKCQRCRNRFNIPIKSTDTTRCFQQPIGLLKALFDSRFIIYHFLINILLTRRVRFDTIN